MVLRYANRTVGQCDLNSLKAFGFDKTKGRKGHRYVTFFIDLNKDQQPVVFARQVKGGKLLLKAFKSFPVG